MQARLTKEEILRIEKMSENEKELQKNSRQWITGIDEAGRGPLAGPVVAAACILPPKFRLAGINDSKQLTSQMRAKLYKKLTKHPKVFYGVGIVDVETIDEINIHRASLLAMERAVQALPIRPDFLLVDGRHLPDTFLISAKAIIKGDSKSISIAAASIIAKYTRDELMKELHKKYPMYLFHQHKGYGTKIHLEMLKLYGPSEVHRKSFEPVKALLEGRNLDNYAVAEILD